MGLSGNSNGKDESTEPHAQFLPLSKPHDATNMSSGNTSQRCSGLRTLLRKMAKPCWIDYHKMPPNPSRMERVRYSLMCPPHGPVSRFLTLVLAVLLIWGAIWSITLKQALPGGNFFGILLLVVLCMVGGELVGKIRLPPLLGMLLVGCLLRNVPVVNYGKDIDRYWASGLRTIALCVILIRAGLGLDPKALKKTFGIAFRLAAIPGWVECGIDGIVAHYLLGLPWLWAFVLGFVMSAVSPAVVVPSMIGLQEKGLGVGEGIPTLLIAGASLNDVVAISGFGITLGIAFSKADLVYTILHGPLEAIIGIAWGVIFGVVLWYIPAKKHESKVIFRTILICGGGIFALFGSRAAHFPGAGALGTLIMAFVAGLGWRKEGWVAGSNPVGEILVKVWRVFQPLLFGLIGNEIDINKLDGSVVGLGIAMLFIGLILRTIVAFFSAFGYTFNMKEKFFIALSWLPKATVQAAIGPVALDTAREIGADEETIQTAMKILAMAVLSIIITAPIGAAAIALSAPRLLKKVELGEEMVKMTSADRNENMDEKTGSLEP
ncbi:sodium/hydrogen exchanger 9B2-like [Liolophura sinensis]|uniref:sodium/hydrogen exchanger 9B2-like n=1 Tax=Liolophura sinensis TaxID=3198878 RepID=UPI00315821EC